MAPLLPVADATARIIEGVEPLAAETVASPMPPAAFWPSPLAARRTQPPFAASAMDGYAVRAADLAKAPARLKLIGASAAGHGFAGTLGPGEAVRISTGAPVPAGADAVLIQENADTPDAATVVAEETVAAGAQHPPRRARFQRGRPPCSTPGARWACASSALPPPWATARCPSAVARGSRSSRPATSWCRRATLPGPDQIVSSNAVGIAALVDAPAARPPTSASPSTTRTPSPAPSTRPWRSPPTFSSPSAAPRSATTTWCRMRSPAAAWTSASGGSPCGPASR